MSNDQRLFTSVLTVEFNADNLDYSPKANSRCVMKEKLIVFYCLALAFSSKAQSTNLPIGQWQSHLPYTTAVSVADADDRVYLATDLSLYEVDKVFHSVQYHNKITGLSDMGVSRIAYNRDWQRLIIAYSNGNIDVMDKDGGIDNYAAIYRNDNIMGSKNIHHIHCNGNLVYFACDFGLTVLDLEIGEFIQTTFTPQHIVYASATLADTVFMSTNRGIYKGNRQTNLLDFGNWHKQNAADGIPVASANYNSYAIINIGNDVYADVNDTLLLYRQGAWQHLAAREQVTDTLRPKFFTAGHSNLLLKTNYHKNKLYVMHGSAKEMTVEYNIATQKFYNHTQYYGFGIEEIEVDSLNEWFAAAAKTGGWHLTSTWYPLSPNGPKDEIVSDMAIDEEGTLWVTGTGFEGGAKFDNRGTYRYKDGTWTYYDLNAFPDIANFRDHIRIALHPLTKEPYVGSHIDGLMHIDNDTDIRIYNKNTPDCSLQGAVGDELRTRVHSLAFDENNNLWICNDAAVYPLSVLMNDGSWQSFDLPSSDAPKFVAIDQFGYKWIALGDGNLLVFDEGDLANNNDNEFYQITTANELGSENVNCIVADRESGMWVGTQAGITIFNCPQDIFGNGCMGSRPVVNPDNFNGHLLESENVRTIAVDGGNRKWIGTDNGVFVLSPDGYEQIAYFTAENSPLFDNRIKKIAIDGSSGNVYIATEKGLQSLRAEATTAEKTMSRKEAHVYPNPVRPDYEGLIAIDNLTEDANIKITDVSGRLVYETQAYGGQAVWDGADYNGRRACTGVYLVFAVSDDGKQKMVTKLVFLP